MALDPQKWTIKTREAFQAAETQATAAGNPYVTPAHEGFDPDYGARPLKRVLQRRIEDPLALAVLQGVYRDGDTITIDVVGEQLTFR
jgi:ATP-dependent Clp protease ATP-binding subunit ClpA